MNTALTALTRPRICIRRFELHQQMPDVDAHHVGGAEHGQRNSDRQEVRAQAEHDGRDAEHGDAAEHPAPT